MKPGTPAVFLLLAMCLLAQRTNAQYEQVWAFGNQAGINFNALPPQPIRTSIKTLEACASVCDQAGQLLFYTDGTQVWNRNHVQMPNGSGLTPFSYVNNPSAGQINATSSSTQGTLIVPILNTERYYIFSITPWELGPERGYLYYSIVDMSLDNNSGDIDIAHKAVLIDSNLTEAMTAVAGNECNIWLLVVSHWQMASSIDQPDTLKAYNIDYFGINPSPVITSISGNVSGNESGIIGSMQVSPDKSKLAIANGKLTLYDFNSYSGVATNPLTMSVKSEDYYSVCFSPDNSKLYAIEHSFNGSLNQFELGVSDSTSILNSKTLITPVKYAQMKAGPDQKIYISAPNTDNTAIHRINEPDAPGIACQFQEGAILLDTTTKALIGLPNQIVHMSERDSQHSFQNKATGCFAAQLLLQPNARGKDHIWDNGSTGAQRIVSQPGLYWVSYQTACTIFTDTFSVSFPYGTLPSIRITPSCRNDQNGKASVSTVPWDTIQYHYRWFKGDGTTLSSADSIQGIAAGNYKLRIFTPYCDTVIAIYIDEVMYKVSFEADSLVCIGESIQFKNSSAQHFEHFKWNYPDDHHSELPEPEHAFSHPGNFEVRLIGVGPICSDTAYKNIRVDPPLEGLMLKKDMARICIGQKVNLTPIADSTVLKLHWEFGDGSFLFSDIEPVQHAFDKDGMNSIVLQARLRACPDVTTRDSIYVYPLPLINLGPDSVLCMSAPSITLSNHVMSPSVFNQYKWSTGETTEFITISHDGVYQLSVTNEFNCSNTKEITISKDCYLEIPNAFTPNGDGINDYFFPRQLLSKNVTQFYMQVFHKWGQLLYETTNKDGRGWDGKFNNKDQVSGIYVYRISIMFGNGRTEQYDGNVTLLR